MVNLTKVFHSARDFIVQTYQNVFKENYDEAEYSDNNENYDESEQVGYFQLFRFATPFDWFLMFLGVIFTALKALSSTLQTVICGEYLTLLIDRTLRNTTVSKSTKSDEELDTTLLRMFGGGRLTYNATDEENHSALMEDAVSVGKFLFTLSMLQFLFSIFCVDLFNHTALKQVSRIRVKFLNSLIRQEVGWFDCATSDSNFAVRVLEDIERIRDAISEKVSHFLDLLFSFTFSIAISFYYGWKLTLVIITYVPILFVSNYIVIKFQAYFSANESNGYAIASSVSEDVLGGIRTVVAFGGEEKEAQRYKKLLSKPERAAILGGATAGVGEGIAGFVLFISNAVAYWYGFSLVLADKDNTEKEYTPTVLMIVFTMSCAGGEQLYSMEPFLQSFAIARGVAATIFKIIDRKSNIDPMSKDGIIKSDLKGDIEFKDVEFSYPSRTETKILNDFSGKFINGQTVALVGSSGNGKSTCLQLLQRFYDPTAGRILIDGHDIKDLNLSWLRSNMAFVGQEPALFATTIEENIRYGKPDASKEQIVESAKKAGAHDFIVELQKGYETLVGERGCQLSGGQKQRIAIARALINNPKILLLDEATAALDSHSEKLVQQALNEASKGRTTIVVSHRNEFICQEPALFATTIEENIRYGKPDASKEQIVESAKKAGAHDFIVELQKGYETLVGERGCQLSGGQKQRIAIARALINNPKILLLDEATAALDSHSEKLVQQALNEASKGRTTIVVSHRLSAIRNADRILFIKKGKIIEAGSHDELLALQGCYYDMMTSPNTVIENVNSFSDNDYENDDELDEKHQLADSQQLQGSKESPTDDIEEKEPLELWPVSKRILTSSKSGYSIFLLAILLSVLVSVCSVGHSLLFAEFFTAIARDDSDEAREVVAYICIALAALGIIDGVLAYYRIYFFTKTGVLMTSKIQGKAFAAMLSQDMAWFDEPKNAVGALSVRLTGDAGTLRGAIGYPICEITNLVFRFVSGSVISFIYSWKLALVTLPIGIFVMLSVYLEKVWSERTEQAEKQGFEEITKVATESILNIRTVASLRQEPHVIARYCAEENKVKKIIRQRLSIRGLSFSFGETIPYLGYTLLLYCGGVLVANEGVDSKSMIIVTEAMLEGTLTLGEILVFVPSIILALFAAHRLFKVTDRKPQIKSPEIFNVSRKSDKSNNVLFNQICFNYPTRPNVNVLQNINLDAPEGKTVALVGPSGCGKSTCIQLLQRLYDPENGRIFVGLDEISRDITLKDLRSKLSIVSQEPVLFDRTIAENIEYGDNSRVVDMTQIIEAAKMANIHDFITSLPMGYDTRLGMRQTQLSGGQKQRVAIARALVRNPKVLLMDEATSALDAANEKAVQDALDLARTGRTCIVIAHRLSTIKNSDLIYVIQNGSICEQGSHHQLMELGGLYSKLYSMQTKVEKVN